MFDMYIINALFLFLLQSPSRKAAVLWLQLIPNKSRRWVVPSLLKVVVNLWKIGCLSHPLVLKSQPTDLRPDFLYLSASVCAFAKGCKSQQLLCHLTGLQFVQYKSGKEITLTLVEYSYLSKLLLGNFSK